MTKHILLDTSPMVAHMRRKINLAEALPEVAWFSHPCSLSENWKKG